MADNYLEKRMEDYVRGRQVSAPRHAGPRPGWLNLRYPPLTVFVRNADTSAGEAVVGLFVQSGCKVVFTASGRKSGTDVARRCGGRFYPVDTPSMLADMHRRGEAPDVEVICMVKGEAASLEKQSYAGKLVVVAGEETDLPSGLDAVMVVGADTAQAARIALMAAHASASMPGQIIRV